MMDLGEIKLTILHILLLLGLYDDDVVEAVNEVFDAIEMYFIYIIVTIMVIIILFNI